MQNRKCPECGFQIIGRTDKKFCSDSCRTRFNNVKNKEQNEAVKRIDRILKHNRKILLSFILEGNTKTDYKTLENSGFNFNYYTAIVNSPENARCFCCYDVGYFYEDNRIIHLKNIEI